MLSSKNTKKANFLFTVDMLKNLLAQELITEKEVIPYAVYPARAVSPRP